MQDKKHVIIQQEPSLVASRTFSRYRNRSRKREDCLTDILESAEKKDVESVTFDVPHITAPPFKR